MGGSKLSAKFIFLIGVGLICDAPVSAVITTSRSVYSFVGD